MKAQTLYDKIIELHTIENLTADGRERLVYIDRTVVNEYTSPQAFSLLRENKLQVWRPSATLGTVDHVNSSASDRTEFPSEENSCTQVKYLLKNGADFNFEVLNNGNPKQGIEHVVMVERGKVLPGMLIGAGDSHTAMYGALGAVAYGIGTSDIYHYLATSTLRYKKLKNMRVCVTGQRGAGVSAKDIILFIVKKLGAGGCTGHCVEFCGPVISDLTAEERLTLCNMAVECAARSSVIAPDEKVFEYLKGKECSPTGELWDEAVSFWRTLRSDPDAAFDKEETIDITGLEPSVTWGTSPDQNCFISEAIPNPEEIEDPKVRADFERALLYMGLKGGQKIKGLPITHAFIGSCTNSRIEDLRAATAVLKGKKLAPGVWAMVVPGSTQVRAQAEREGIDKIFKDAGWEWRNSGCSLCLAMNGDILDAQDRCISATNRNFEGRQGVQTRTHLASPQMVALASVKGFIADIREE